MAKNDDIFRKVIAHAKEYGYIFASSEIYDGLSAVYDYAQNGAELKKNLKDYWWRSMVYGNQEIVGIDSSILMHPKIWEASGHVDAFNDPLIDNRDSKRRYRADVLIEEYVDKIEAKIEREIRRAEKRFGEAFDKEEFVTTNERVLRYKAEGKQILQRMGDSLAKDDLEDVKKLIEELEIACPVSGSRDWTDVRQFNLMFSTKLGASAENAMDLYLRPETAQGIFVNFQNVQQTSRQHIPFGIAQIGKAFRNEIVARQFVFRMREFEQMEMQYFVKPGEELDWYEKWKETRLAWHHSLGMGEENYRFQDHENLSHYANAATDIQFNFPFGFRELEGIHSRTDFDLKAHEEHSGRNMKYFDPFENKSYFPYVVETSIGLDRLVLAILSNSYTEEDLGDGKSRVVLKIPAIVAPVKAAVLPLIRRDGLPELAQEIVKDLQWDYNVIYDDKESVGRRYRRQDAAGTPFCITVDHQTLEDKTVTIRHRDSMEQERVKISELHDKMKHSISQRDWLEYIKK